MASCRYALGVFMVVACALALGGCPGEGAPSGNEEPSGNVDDSSAAGNTSDDNNDAGDDTQLDRPVDAGDEGDGGATAGVESMALESIYGEYDVTIAGRVGGPYEPTGSIVSGTTAGVVDFAATGSVALSASQPGVIAVPSGTSIPGVAPEDVIFGAAYMCNPIHVFLGTRTVDAAGDFGLYEMVTIGIPADPVDIYPEYDGRGQCEVPADQPFACSPTFFQSTAPSGSNVNLIYFVTQVEGDGERLTVRGELRDTHTAEAAAANLFTVPIESPLLGNMNDQFMFAEGASFELTIVGNTLSGTIRGEGRSVAGLVPQTAILEATLSGSK